MDIDQEIAIHLEWIESLVALFGATPITDEAVREVAHHDRCELGRWLNSAESARFCDAPGFSALRQNHAAFHTLAGELVVAFKSGDEAAVLASQVQFLDTSRKVIGELRALKAHAAAG